MSQVENHQAYRGVKCLCCRQPIQISPLIPRTQAAQERKSTLQEIEKCQVFCLRCASCGKERPYKMSEILEFKGNPAGFIPRAESASTHMGTRARAANG